MWGNENYLPPHPLPAVSTYGIRREVTIIGNQSQVRRCLLPRPVWKRFAAPAAELVQFSVQSRLAYLAFDIQLFPWNSMHCRRRHSECSVYLVETGERDATTARSLPGVA